MKDESETDQAYAVVDYLIENRRISNFISSAGLGITGVGRREVSRIIYKKGEIATPERAIEALDKTAELLDKSNSEFKITDPRVVRIFNPTAQ